MNWVDLLILVLLAAAAIHGVLRGAVAQVLAFGGIVAGLALGVTLAPVLAGFAANPYAKTFVSLVTVFGVAGLVGGVGEWLGYKALRHVHAAGLRHVDGALGAGIAVLATLVAVWLIGGMLAAIPSPGPLAAVHDSVIVRQLDQRLPPAPSIFSRVGRFLTRAGFPPVFAGLEPNPAPDVALPADPEVAAAIDAADRSTVRIVGTGCGGIKNGSGFVAGPGLVVTNAHVVAGIDRPVVEDSRGNHRAATVLFDPRLDLAVLRTSGLAGQPLVLRRSYLSRGATGAVLGFPGGGPFQGNPAAVRSRLNALGRDIYGQGLTNRSIYQLAAEVRPGNSGGPFVRSNGEVAGVIFSVSVLDENISYALTSPEVAARVDQVRDRSSQIDTGPCAA